MGRRLNLYEKDLVNQDNNKRLYVDYFGNTITTLFTCQLYMQYAARGYDLPSLALFVLSAFGVYGFYTDTVRRTQEKHNIEYGYTELYSDEEILKLMKKK